MAALSPDARRQASMALAVLLAAVPASGLPTASLAASGPPTAGADTLIGGPEANNIQGLDGADSIRGMDGADLVNGNGGDDTVGGGPGSDEVHGGRGSDMVNGGQGDDTVSGDRDNDTLAGGLGADRFIFDAASGSDVITDFASVGGDRIELPPGAQYVLADTPQGLTITLTDGGQLRLVGMTTATVGTWLASAPATTGPEAATAEAPAKAPSKVLLAAIVALAIAFVGLLSVGLYQLVRGRRRP